MRACWTIGLLVFVTGAARAEDAGQLEYARIERDFPQLPRAAALAAIDAIAARFPASPAAPAALSWRAQLALVDGDLDGAGRRYAALLTHYPGCAQAPFAHRGLGDVYLRQRRFDEAQREYRRALVGADEPLRAELGSRQKLVARARHRRALFHVALLACAGGALALAARAARGRGRLRLPVEVVYALPVFALLLAAARFAAATDARVSLTLALCATGALPLIALSGIAAARRPSPRRRDLVLHLAVLLVALLGLLYAVAWAGGFLDPLAGARA